MNAHSLRSILRRNLVSITVLLMCSLVVVSGFSYSRAQSEEKEEREVVEKIPKHLPIKVKIKKPEKLKDAKNEDWLDDMEIEVTNTGTKPIYLLRITLDMPDVWHESGKNYAFTYKYGRNDLVAWEEPVRPDDVPLRPGETVTLNPPANHIEGWKGVRKEGRIKNPQKIEFVFRQINFGDGTGFAGERGTPMPMKRQRSSNDLHAGGESAMQTVSHIDAHADPASMHGSKAGGLLRMRPATARDGRTPGQLGVRRPLPGGNSRGRWLHDDAVS